MLIGGPGVARGYLKRDELTAEKFIANPFDADGSDPILYRSGDAVALDENGNLSFRGRIDDQIKIRGFRVELGEIEAVLSEQQPVRQAAVVLRNENGIDELVAFLVVDEPIEDVRDLRMALRERLPPYMVPSRYEIVTSLPKLSSGKVDRKALKRIELTAPAAVNEEQEDPRNETELKLLEAAKRVLPPGAIPFDADFFTDLGGHSLLAARFVSLVRETPRLATITLQDMYTQRSLRALAAHLDGKAEAHARPARSLLRAPAAAATFPLRTGAGGRPAVHPRHRHVAMARRLRLLHAGHFSRRQHFRGIRRAARHLYVHQHRHGSDVDYREMACDRTHKAGALSSMGRLLLPMVAVAAPDRPHPRQMVSGVASHAAVSHRSGRKNRRRRAHQRVGHGRDRPRHDRRRRQPRLEAQALQRESRRQ